MRCIKCQKEGAYIRTRTKDVICRLCGHIEPLNVEPLKETKQDAEPMDSKDQA